MKLAIKVSEIITETLKEEIGEEKTRRKKTTNESKQRKIDKDS